MPVLSSQSVRGRSGGAKSASSEAAWLSVVVLRHDADGSATTLCVGPTTMLDPSAPLPPLRNQEDEERKKEEKKKKMMMMMMIMMMMMKKKMMMMKKKIKENDNDDDDDDDDDDD